LKLKKLLRKGLGIIVPLVLAQLVIATSMANPQLPLKYNIDGNLSDWGITIDDLKQGFYPNCSKTAWLPNGSNVVFIIEDNRDPDYGPASGGYPTGVHIYGKGSNYQKYDEPMISTQIPPIGGEYFDIEAIYLDEDSNYIYVALVLSTDSKTMGDLAMNLDCNKATGGYGYEYGVLLNTNNTATQFDIYSTPTDQDWTKTDYVTSSPGYINLSNNPSVVGHAIGAYVKYPDLKDWDVYPTYIVEMAISKADVGLSGQSIGITTGASIKTVISKFHITSTGDCGNDLVEDGISISEFLSILIPTGIAIGLVYCFRRK